MDRPLLEPKNYLVRISSRVRSISTHYALTIVAPDMVEAEGVAKRLAALLPGESVVLDVVEV